MTIEDGLRLAKLAEDATAELASPGPYHALPTLAVEQSKKWSSESVQCLTLMHLIPAGIAKEVWQEAACDLCYWLQESLGVHVVPASYCKGGVLTALDHAECDCQFGLCTACLESDTVDVWADPLQHSKDGGVCSIAAFISRDTFFVSGTEPAGTSDMRWGVDTSANLSVQV